jgi:hypothetical protein
VTLGHQVTQKLNEGGTQIHVFHTFCLHSVVVYNARGHLNVFEMESHKSLIYLFTIVYLL